MQGPKPRLEDDLAHAEDDHETFAQISPRRYFLEAGDAEGGQISRTPPPITKKIVFFF